MCCKGCSGHPSEALWAVGGLFWRPSAAAELSAASPDHHSYLHHQPLERGEKSLNVQQLKISNVYLTFI